MLEWDKPKPRSKVPPAAKRFHWGCKALDRHRCDVPNPWNCQQPGCGGRICSFVLENFFQLRDLLGQRRYMLKIEPRHLDNEQIQRCLNFFYSRFEDAYVSHALRRNYAMFGKVSAKRIDQLRSLANQQIPRPKDHRASLLAG